MDQAELDGCPFCGGTAALVRTKDIAQWWYGECRRCYTRQLASQEMEQAARKWNTRSAMPEIAAAPA